MIDIRKDENAPLVIHIVNNLKDAWPRMSTIWMEEFGFNGLCVAYANYKKDSGIKFGTYAYSCIRNEIIRYCKFWYKRIVFEYGIRGPKEYYTGSARVFVDPPDEADPTEGQEQVDYIIDTADMDERHKKAIRLRMEGYLYKDIGIALGVSRERGRQISNMASKKVKKRIEEVGLC